MKLPTIPKPHRYDAVMIFARRFRLRTLPVMSLLAGNTSMITEPGSDENVEKVPEWYAKLWPPLYWLRARWDGLRYGLDRDRRP